MRGSKAQNDTINNDPNDGIEEMGVNNPFMPK